MKKLQRLELLKDMVQEAIDRGASSVEQIHQYVADLPFEALERSGLLDDDRLKLRSRQRHTIGTVYEAIRRVNRQIGELISDQCENLEEGTEVAQVLDRAPEATAPRAKVRARAKPAKSADPQRG